MAHKLQESEHGSTIAELSRYSGNKNWHYMWKPDPNGGPQKGALLIDPVLQAIVHSQLQYSESQRARLKSEADSQPFGTIKGTHAKLPTLARHIFAEDKMAARHLVGFQPMQGPVGLVYRLAYKEHEPERHAVVPEETKAGFFQTNPGKKLSLEVVSQAVEAGSRRLEAGCTLEVVQDLRAVHGLDIEAEMIAALAHQIRDEIQTEIIEDLKWLAQKHENYDVVAKLPAKNVSPLDQVMKLRQAARRTDGAFHITMTIHRAANNIARTTRRGAGNKAIVSPAVFKLLFETQKWSRAVLAFDDLSESFCKELAKGHHVLQSVGCLNGQIELFVSNCLEDDEILVAYKGGDAVTLRKNDNIPESGSWRPNEVDTGYIYAPYVGLMTDGVVVDPKTFQPVVPFMTSYGKAVSCEDGFTNSDNYYRMVKIQTPSEDPTFTR